MFRRMAQPAQLQNHCREFADCNPVRGRTGYLGVAALLPPKRGRHAPLPPGRYSAKWAADFDRCGTVSTTETFGPFPIVAAPFAGRLPPGCPRPDCWTGMRRRRPAAGPGKSSPRAWAASGLRSFPGRDLGHQWSLPPIVHLRPHLGVPDIVRHTKTGFLFEPDDLEGFASALAELVKDSELRSEMGWRARAFVEENHSLARLPAYLGGLYQQALLKTRHSQAEPAMDTSSLTLTRDA